MNLTALLALMPVSTWAAVIAATIIPMLSSFLTKAHWDSSVTGILTLLLTTAAGFFSEWAQAGSDFNIRTAIGTAILSYGWAVLNRVGWLKSTGLESKLVLAGSTAKVIDMPSPPPELPATNPDDSDVMQQVKQALAEANQIHPHDPPDPPPLETDTRPLASPAHAAPEDPPST